MSSRPADEAGFRCGRQRNMKGGFCACDIGGSRARVGCGRGRRRVTSLRNRIGLIVDVTMVRLRGSGLITVNTVRCEQCEQHRTCNRGGQRPSTDGGRHLKTNSSHDRNPFIHVWAVHSGSADLHHSMDPTTHFLSIG